MLQPIAALSSATTVTAGKRLPIPRPGQVLGLVGTNGIGKSTALNVTSGKLKPNLGRFNMHRGGATGGGAGRSGSSSSSSVGLSRHVLHSMQMDVGFVDLRMKFSWEPAKEDAILAKWSIKAADRYRDMVYGFKKNRTKGCPPIMPPEMWEGFKQHWDSEAFKAKSTVASKNRLTEPDGPDTGIVKYRRGSRSAVAHAAALAKKKGVRRNDVAWETFKRLHGTADGSYSDGKSAHIAISDFINIYKFLF